MKPEIVVGAGLLAGLGVVLWRAAQKHEEDGGSAAPSSADGGDPYLGMGSGYAPWASGEPQPAEGPVPTAPGEPGPTFVVLSPDGEDRIIRDAERTNAQVATDNRDSLRRIEANTRTSNAISAAAATAASVPFALYGIAKHGPALGRSVTAAARAAAGILPPLSAPGATITQLGAVTGAGWAVGAAGGAALGLAGVKVLDTTGVLDRGEKASAAIAQHTPQAAQTVAKSLLLAPAAVGAIATGLVGHGNVGGNLRKAYQGTIAQKVVNGGVSWTRKRFGWG